MFSSPINYTKFVNTERLEKEIRESLVKVSLNHTTTVEDSVDIYFNADIDETDKGILDSIIVNHINTPLVPPAVIATVKIDSPKTSSGHSKISVYPAEGGATTIVTHNFADKCSWYMGAIQVIKGAMSNAGLTYSTINNKTHFIDLQHGRIYDEDNIMANTQNIYKVKVYVDDVEVVSGFTIDYVLGTITFAIDPVGVVTASYWYADKSYFKVRPKEGKVLGITTSEVQFAANTSLVPSGPFVFELWFSSHPVYGTMAVPGQKTKYKNFKDFISACNEGQGLIPKIGELTQDVHVFPFNYVRPKPIKYTDYVEIRVYCENHEAVSGEYATATFYVSVDDIPVV